MVIPRVSILAEPPVALVDKVADRLGTREVAQAYLEFLYSPEGQAIAAKHYYRPSDRQVVPSEYLEAFAELRLITVQDVFGGWQRAHQTHFPRRRAVRPDH